MRNITLIDYTGKGSADPLYAARILAYTKNTRLNMTPNGMAEVMSWPEERILEEMRYMTTTIQSSWEFVDCTFLISDVSRATAQQITRTRTGSYAMQSQRVTDMSAVTWDHRGEQFGIELYGVTATFDDCMRGAVDNYSGLVQAGMPLEDARDLLPIGVHCNLVAKYNLRTIVELCRSRDSLRVQGPYVSISKQIKASVVAVWPWAEAFFTPPNESAIEMIEEVAKELAAINGEKGAMYKGLSGKLAKAADLIKKG